MTWFCFAFKKWKYTPQDAHLTDQCTLFNGRGSHLHQCACTVSSFSVHNLTSWKTATPEYPSLKRHETPDLTSQCKADKCQPKTSPGSGFLYQEISQPLSGENKRPFRGNPVPGRSAHQSRNAHIFGAQLKCVKVLCFK